MVNLNESNTNMIEFEISLIKFESLCEVGDEKWINPPFVTGQVVVIQLLDWIFRGVAQVMFVNNPLSGLLITAALFLQSPWWAVNGLLGTLVSTVSAILLGQKRSEVHPFYPYMTSPPPHGMNPLSLPLSLIFPEAALSLAFTLCYFHSLFLI